MVTLLEHTVTLPEPYCNLTGAYRLNRSSSGIHRVFARIYQKSCIKKRGNNPSFFVYPYNCAKNLSEAKNSLSLHSEICNMSYGRDCGNRRTSGGVPPGGQGAGHRENRPPAAGELLLQLDRKSVV